MDYKKECSQLKVSTIEDLSLDRWQKPIEQKLQKYLELIKS